MDTLRVNQQAADLLREAYTFGGGARIGTFDGAAVRAGDVSVLLKGLDGLAEEGNPHAAAAASELRKASRDGRRGVAIAGPEAEAHEQLHFAVDRLKFDAAKIMDHGPTRVAVIEARSRGLASGSDERVIREVVTRILNGEGASLKINDAAADGVLRNVLDNSTHTDAEIDTLEALAHESTKGTVRGSPERGSSDSMSKPLVRPVRLEKV